MSTSTGTEASATAAASVGHLPFVGDVRTERVGDAAVVADGVHDVGGAVADVVDRDGQAVACQAPRDGPGERARAARDEGDAPHRRCRARTRRAAPLRATSTTCG